MANLLTNTRKWKRKSILFKTEGSYGVDAIPTGAANWIEARNVSLTPMDNEKVARNIDLPYFGTAGSVITSTWAKLSFDVAMVGSGTAGTAPKWAPLLMACGMAQTISAGVSVIYNLVSALIPSVTAYINIDGTLHKLLGCRGEAKVKKTAKGTPMINFTFDALYLTPLADPLPAVNRTGWQLEEGVNSINTTAVSLNAVNLSFSDFEYSLGNKISRIDLPGPQREITITDRAPQSSITILAPDLADFNPFTLAEAGTTVPLSVTHGSVAGKKVKSDLQVVIVGVDYDRIEENLAYKLTLEPKPVSGDDEIAITCL